MTAFVVWAIVSNGFIIFYYWEINMPLSNSTEGILTIELIIFTAIIIAYFLKPTTPTDINKDIDNLTDFLDKVEEESLIRLSDIDERDNTRDNSIKRNVDVIDEKLKHCKSAESCSDIHIVSREYLKILTAIEAIRAREIKQLKKEIEQLKRKRSKNE